MDAIKNPFSPGAGSPPPELVGRSGILEQARILLGRVKEKRPEKSILLTGLRGVGKTVLLNEIDRLALAIGYRTLFVEAHEHKSLAALLVPPLRSLLFEFDRLAKAGNRARRALAVLRGFINSVKVSMGDLRLAWISTQSQALQTAVIWRATCPTFLPQSLKLLMNAGSQ